MNNKYKYMPRAFIGVIDWTSKSKHAKNNCVT